MLAECRCRLLRALGHASTRCARSRARRLLGLGGLSAESLNAVPRPTSDQLISSPDNELVRRLRRLAHRREPGLALLEGPRVLAEAKAAGVEFEVLVVREGDKLPFHSSSRVTLAPSAYRAATQTVTLQGVMAIARVHDAAGRGGSEKCGVVRLRQRGPWSFPPRPGGGLDSTDLRRRVVECCGRGRGDPFRACAEEGGVSQATELRDQALAAISTARD